MSKCWTLMAVLVGAFMGGATGSLAGEATAEEQSKKIEELQERVKALEAKGGEKPAEKKKESWTDRFSLNGDIRLRYERVEEDRVDDRERFRFRVRLGLKAKVNDDVDFGFRLATGSASDPISTNQTMGDSASKKAILVDQAQVTYHPSVAPGLSVIGGKMGNPLYLPGGSDLLWDHDLTPEGLAVKYCPKFGDFEIHSTLATFYFLERYTSGNDFADSSMLGIQAGLKYNFLEKKAYALLGLGYLDYFAIKGRTPFLQNRGNTLTGGAYTYDFNNLECYLEGGYTLDISEDWKLPLMVFAHFTQNIASDIDEDKTAWILGLGVGKLDKPGSFSFSYSYCQVEKDSMVSSFADSDRWGGGTDGNGHKFNAQIQAMKNVSFSLTWLLNTRLISDVNPPATKDTGYNRLQFDCSVKF
jgi:hypothetical protein